MLLFTTSSNDASSKKKVVPSDQLFIVDVASIATVYVPYL